CAGKARARTAAKAAARTSATPLLAEAAVTLLEGAHGAEEIGRPERRPVDVAEVELAVRALPEEEPRQAHLAARPDDEVGIGQIGRVEVLGERLLRDALDDRIEVLAMFGLLEDHRLHRVDVILAPAECDVEIPCTDRACLERVNNTSLQRVVAVAVDDDAEVPVDGAIPDLPKEAPLVEVVEERDHQPFECRLPPTPVVILGKNLRLGYILP